MRFSFSAALSIKHTLVSIDGCLGDFPRLLSDKAVAESFKLWSEHSPTRDIIPVSVHKQRQYRYEVNDISSSESKEPWTSLPLLRITNHILWQSRKIYVINKFRYTISATEVEFIDRLRFRYLRSTAFLADSKFERRSLHLLLDLSSHVTIFATATYCAVSIENWDMINQWCLDLRMGTFVFLIVVVAWVDLLHDFPTNISLNFLFTRPIVLIQNTQPRKVRGSPG